MKNNIPLYDFGGYKCWRKNGCHFNSNNSWRYKKCLRESYTEEQCKKDNEERFA